MNGAERNKQDRRKRCHRSRIQPLSRAEGATAPLAWGSREAERHQLLLCMSTITTFAHTRCISPSVFLHLLGAKIHLPPQREARRLRRTPQNQCCGTFLSRCVRTAHTHLLFAQRAKNTTCPKGRYNRAGRRDITRGKAADITETRRLAAVFHCGAAAQCAATRGTSKLFIIHCYLFIK